MNLYSFYKDNFNSDPYQILDAAYDEIIIIATEAGVDWSAIADKIKLSEIKGRQEKFSSYNKNPPRALEKKLKGRVEVYSRIETTNTGIKYPFINFVKKGSDAGTWSGLQFLYAKYNSLKNGTMVSHDLNSEKIAKKRAEREKLLKLAEEEEQKKRDYTKKIYNEFYKQFENAKKETGSFSYAVKKQIQPIFNKCNIKNLRDVSSDKNIIAIPLSHVNSNKIIGWQRIYENGSKKLTSAIEDGDYKGACYIIGDLKNAKKIILAEGFATTATVYMSSKSKFDAAIMCISANNLIHVIDHIIDNYPKIEIVVALDNDHLTAKNGNGNTGIRYGLEILKKHSKIKCVYPRFDNFSDENLSDFNDLYIKMGKSETTRQLFSHENKLLISTDQLKTELTTLSVTATKNKKLFVKQLYTCIDVGMSRCPVNYSPRELIELINKYLKHLNVLNIYESTVRNRVCRQFAKAQIKAQSTRSFSNKITDTTLRPDHITYKRFKTHVINDEILEYIKNLRGPVIVRAGMGSGKSKHLLKPLMHKFSSGISLAHRISLTASLYDMMTDGKRSKSEIFNYQENGLNEISCCIKKLILCVNSIIKSCWRPLIKDHDFLGFDEATQGLRAICTSKIVKYPVDVFNQLILAIASSREHAVLVDADANDTLIELCEIAIKKREELNDENLKQWTQIHVIELPVDVSYIDKNGNKRNREVFYTDCDRVFAEILDTAKNNERFLVATDNKNRADQLINELNRLYPKKKWLYVSQDTTPSDDVIEFTDAPNKTAIKYDGLIYSPAISSGVSIEVPHFKKHFGLFSGVIVPSDAIQMLRRDRTATSFMIGLDKITGLRAETAENIRRGFIQAMIDTGEINQEFCDASLEEDKLSLGLADTQFTKMKIKIMELESTSRANFANNLLHILNADGYEVKHLAKDEIKSSEGKSTRKEAKKRVNEIELMRYLNAETPDLKLRDELLEKRTLTEEEKAQLTRFDIENELCLDVNEETINFWLKNGKNKIKLVEIRDMPQSEAATIDKEEQAFVFLYKYKLNNHSDYMIVNAFSQNEADEKFRIAHPKVDSFSVSHRPAVEITSRTYASLHRKLLRKYFKDCGIDLITGKGEVTTDAMQIAMNNLISTERIQMFNNVIKFGGYSDTKNKQKRSDVLFKSICKSLGYKVDKRRLPRSKGRGYVWFIDAESWSFISNITERRKDKGKSINAKSMKNKDHDMIPDFGSIYNNKNKNEDHSIKNDWTQIVTTAIKDLPIDLEWAINVLNDEEREWFINENLHINYLTITFINIYITEFLVTIKTSDLNILKERANAIKMSMQ